MLNTPQIIDIKHAAKDSDAFRSVVFTAERTQLVTMSLEPGEDIGLESHPADQLLFVVKGEGTALVNGETELLAKDAVLCVPAGIEHNVTNTGDEPMKLFTVYAPPQHAPGTIHRTKADAGKAELPALSGS